MPGDVTAAEQRLVGKTFGVRRLGRLMLVVHPPGVEPSDEDWREYIELSKEALAEEGALRVLVIAGTKPPNSRQRSLYNGELPGDKIRIALVGAPTHMMPILVVFTWFSVGTKAFKRDELRQALDFLEVAHEPRLIEIEINQLQTNWT